MRLGHDSTADEAVAGIDLSGRRAVVTGGASGIGIPTARALAGAGAQVTLAVRNPDAARALAAEIGADVRRLDLADLASVDAFTRGWAPGWCPSPPAHTCARPWSSTDRLWALSEQAVKRHVEVG